MTLQKKSRDQSVKENSESKVQNGKVCVHDWFYHTIYDNQYRTCQNCGLEEYKKWEWVKA